MINVALFDVDGVLTDGAVWIDSRGEEIKRILFDDIDALFALKRAGIKIGFITGENTAFCDYLEKRFSPHYFIRGCKNKLESFKEIEKNDQLCPDSVCFVGDSFKDRELLKYLTHGIAPADAPEEVIQSAKIKLQSVRGKGVVRESSQYIFKHNKTFLKGSHV